MSGNKCASARQQNAFSWYKITFSALVQFTFWTRNHKKTENIAWEKFDENALLDTAINQVEQEFCIVHIIIQKRHSRQKLIDMSRNKKCKAVWKIL